MQLIRGTTPTIVVNVKSELDFTMITEVWLYIAQQNKVKVDKELENVTLNEEKKTITCVLSQEDTLSLKDGDATIQIRILLSDGTALANKESKVTVLPVRKQGVITNE